MRTRHLALLAIPLVLAMGCGEGSDPTAPTVTPSTSTPPVIGPPIVVPQDPVAPTLSDEVVAGRFRWPEQDFSYDNRAPLETRLKKNDLAVDFTLMDLSRNAYTLSELLATKPVILLTGSFSCPYYHIAIEDFRSLAGESVGARRIGDSVHIVHVYTVEAHPKLPDVSPNYGTAFESEFSLDLNARKYPERVVAARRIAPQIPQEQILLLDGLRPEGPDNPVWGTYGTGASSAYLIDQEGKLRISQLWADPVEMRNELGRLLSSSDQ